MTAARFERDISATLAELHNWILAAYPQARVSGAGRYLIETAAATLELAATPGPERRIALLRLPTLRLDYRFTRGDTGEHAALLKRLDLFMHRGGG